MNGNERNFRSASSSYEEAEERPPLCEEHGVMMRRVGFELVCPECSFEPPFDDENDFFNP